MHVEVRDEDDELLRAAEELGIDLSPACRARPRGSRPWRRWRRPGARRPDGEMASPADEALDDLDDVELASGESEAEEADAAVDRRVTRMSRTSS